MQHESNYKKLLTLFFNSLFGCLVLLSGWGAQEWNEGLCLTRLEQCWLTGVVLKYSISRENSELTTSTVQIPQTEIWDEDFWLPKVYKKGKCADLILHFYFLSKTAKIVSNQLVKFFFFFFGQSSLSYL